MYSCIIAMLWMAILLIDCTKENIIQNGNTLCMDARSCTKPLVFLLAYALLLASIQSTREFKEQEDVLFLMTNHLLDERWSKTIVDFKPSIERLFWSLLMGNYSGSKFIFDLNITRNEPFFLLRMLSHKQLLTLFWSWYWQFQFNSYPTYNQYYHLPLISLSISSIFSFNFSSDICKYIFEFKVYSINCWINLLRYWREWRSFRYFDMYFGSYYSSNSAFSSAYMNNILF